MDSINKDEQLPNVKSDLDKTQLKANATSDQLNTFFDHERNTAHLINNIKHAASDEEDEHALLQGANSSSNGSSAIPGSVQMNLSNQGPPVDTSQMSINNQSKSDAHHNLISNSFTQHIDSSASGISLKEMNAGAGGPEHEDLLDQNKPEKANTETNE